MFRTLNDQPTLWDARLPPEYLRMPGELARVEVLLDDEVLHTPFVPYSTRPTAVRRGQWRATCG